MNPPSTPALIGLASTMIASSGGRGNQKRRHARQDVTYKASPRPLQDNHKYAVNETGARVWHVQDRMLMDCWDDAELN